MIAVSQDYIERVIATVRNHRDSENSWPQWANVLADEVEKLQEQLDKALNANHAGGYETIGLQAEVEELREALRKIAFTPLTKVAAEKIAQKALAVPLPEEPQP